MAFPLIALAAVAAVGVAGQAMQTIGQARAAREEYKALHKQAANVLFQSQFRINDIERERMNRRSAQRAAYASRNVKISGSPLEVLAETNELARLDILRTQYTAEVERERLFTQGTNISRQLPYAIGGGILSGMSQLGSSALLASSSLKTPAPATPSGLRAKGKE